MGDSVCDGVTFITFIGSGVKEKTIRIGYQLSVDSIMTYSLGGNAGWKRDNVINKIVYAGFPIQSVYPESMCVRFIDRVMKWLKAPSQRCVISGQKYFDTNQNGIKDETEPGLSNWCIRLLDGSTQLDSALTDSFGNYSFSGIPSGTYTIDEKQEYGWIQTAPLGGEYIGINVSPGEVISHIDFGNFRSINNIKIPLYVYDSSIVTPVNLIFGVQSGASFGIWGIDPFATFVDSTESESELPPPMSGVFDARFVNPDHSPNYFGNGSWVDVRNFVSGTQIDTYKLSFQPSITGYPITFKWSKELIGQSFSGIVRIGKNPVSWVDMKLADSLVITNENPNTLYIVSENPTIPILYEKSWNMISLPTLVEDARKTILFPTSTSSIYKYDHIYGYVATDTLMVGNGYWIKFPGVIPSIYFGGTDLNDNIVHVFTGWNMIGSLANPIPVNIIESDPPGIIASSFFGYNGSYYSSDTLKPFMGYWVKVNQNGQLMLSSPLK